jgi:hypothetical protein
VDPTSNGKKKAQTHKKERPSANGGLLTAPEAVREAEILLQSN